LARPEEERKVMPIERGLEERLGYEVAPRRERQARTSPAPEVTPPPAMPQAPTPPTPAQLRREETATFATEYLAPIVPPMPEIGLAETLAGVQAKPLIGFFGVTLPAKTLTEFVKPRETVRPFAGLAGYVIAPTEKLVYSVGELVGLKTPRPPPELLSLSAQERAAAMAYGPEYAAGTIAGDVLLSIVLGKVTGKVWEVTPKAIKAPLEKIVGAVAKPFRPITKPIVSRLEKAALWPHEHIATGIVNIPTPERVGLGGMEAQFTAWELAEAPKSSAYLISKMPGEPLAKAWATEHIFKTVTGGLSYALVKEQLGATALPTMPYLPKVESAGFAAKGLTRMLGMGIALLPKAFPRQATLPKLETMPNLEPEIKLGLPSFEDSFEVQKQRLFPQVYPSQKQRKRAIPLLGLMIGQKPINETVLVPILKLDVPTRQMQPPILKIPTSTIIVPPTFLKVPPLPTIPPSFRLPRSGEDWSRLGGGLFGKWFKRSHSIPTEKQIMRELGFSTGRKKGTGKRKHKQHKRAKR